ncbi:hypothetical protein BCF53_110155 [Reinekea marinisedimentorum]|uniref:Uncharacterized protein n=1 Tax=Reinekea marinisedimentorum TaxID=230495 RepID=A0A4V2UJI8_9GAMM|nr:hypothetical protein BCF53_110155 [Reinekea marinisedimentorum]
MIRPTAFISALLLASPVFAIGDIDIRADQVLTDTVQEVNFRIAGKLRHPSLSLTQSQNTGYIWVFTFYGGLMFQS